MEAKDWITLIVLVITVISSYWLASKQTRKTKRAKWIEDFRSEIARFLTLSIRVEDNDVNTLISLSESTWVIVMLLDENSKIQLKLIEEVNIFGLFMAEKFNSSHIQEYKERVQLIKDLAKTVINRART
ncbi:hypothetical protein [Mucilaginibacter sp. OK098]|uniref:hypothetical protein n=1 Tax=Mucilaginibacter sp. OK098 TaxID=1855297 RepID=UPI00091547C1|nr:hypothetical protein [Mucilaginibacter sp. OK098]SHN35302.1 hypothetical protein SAMN05216524_11217 [Mucilaginibacter sp. OK098]